jgi:hypothetical protein
VANLKLAQYFKATARAVLNQFSEEGSVDTLLLNSLLGASRDEFEELMRLPAVSQSLKTLSWALFATMDWYLFTTDDWFELLSQPSFVPTKASAYLRVAGVPLNYFDVDGSVCIDAANHWRVTHGDYLFTLDENDGTANGSMLFTDGTICEDFPTTDAVDDDVAGTLKYPVNFSLDSPHTLWVRVQPQGNSVDFDLLIDGQVFESISAAGSTDAWQWVSADFYVPAGDVHTLTIRPRRLNLRFDKIYITRSSDVPTGEGPAYDVSPFVTVHTQLYRISACTPLDALTAYDAKSTADEMTADDWYNFDTSLRVGHLAEPLDDYAFIVTVSGGNEGHFVVWDLAKPVVGMPSSAFDGAVWTLNNDVNYALLLYSDRSRPVGCQVVTKPAQQFNLRVQAFEPQLSSFNGTRLEYDAYAANYGRVVLDTPQRAVSFVVDQSGSMTWNDPEGKRLTLVERAVGRLSNYPATLNYNLFAFGSTLVRPVIFASQTDFRDGTATQIAENFFKTSGAAVTGIRLVRKLGSFPDSAIDGDILKDGIFDRYIDEDLTEGGDYYYAVYAYRHVDPDAAPHFSDPLQLRVTAAARDLPVGVSELVTDTLSGTGVEVDNDVMAAWHMGEGSGTVVHDFSDSEITLTHESSDPCWLNGADTPIGYSGLRFDGTHRLLSAVTTHAALENSLTVMAWVYWYGNAGTIVSRETESGSAQDYAVGVDASGHLTLSVRGALGLTTTVSINANEWTHVAVVLDFAGGFIGFYVDGTEEESVSLVFSLPAASGDMLLKVGDDFRGRMTEVSLHGVVRDADYIAAAAEGDTSEHQDNGDRVVTFEWVQSSLSVGTAVIVQNSDHVPSHPADGTVVYEENLGEGRHAASHSQRFLAGSPYHYRVFVRNTGGGYSVYEDSAFATVTIPTMNLGAVQTAPSPSLEPVTAFVATAGRGKVRLTWEAPSDRRVTGVRVYESTEAYPSVEQYAASGTRIFSGDASATGYVHRDLDDDTTYYYTVVGVNNKGQVSEGVWAKATPSADAEDATFPVSPPTGIRSEPLDSTTVGLAWENPASFLSDATVYFGDRVFLYGMLIDGYGRPLTNVNGISLKAVPTISYDVVEDVFGDGDPTVDQSRLFQLTSTYREDGLLRGGVSFDPTDPALRRVKSISIRTTVVCEYAAGPQTFEYESDPIAVVYRNPVDVTITNLHGDTIDIGHHRDDASFARVDGCYARRKSPIVLRASVTYRGLPVTQIAITTLNRQDEGAGAVDGTASNHTASNSFINLPITPPDGPATTTVFVRTSINGQSRVNAKPLSFKNPLQIEMTATCPQADGRDVAEQFATAWYVNPDDPSDVQHLPDLTPVRWQLSDSGQPFFSTDNVPLPNGVYSYLRDGSAKRVFFGPLSNVTPGTTKFTLSSRVVYDGLNAEDEVEVAVPGVADARTVFLAEFPALANPLWADGIDYVKMTIVHDPTSSSASSAFSDCFLSCSAEAGNEIVPLPAKQPIRIATTDDFEIIWGDVVEIEGSDGNSLDTSAANVASKEATVLLTEGETTDVYFRLNKNELTASTSSLSLSGNRCECFRGNDSDVNDFSSQVLLTTNLFYNGTTIPMRAGGDGVTGFPPTIITPQDPLDIRVVDIRVDGYPSDVVLVDGTSETEIVLEVSWRGSPVPDDTVVEITTTSDSRGVLNFAKTRIRTEAQIDPYLNPNGPLRSFCSVKLLSISPAASFSASFAVKVTYDRGGLTTRTKTALVSILYVGGTTLPSHGSSVYSPSVYKYSVTGSSWSALADLNHPRGGVLAAWANGKLYAIGGTDGKTISQYNEAFDGSSWDVVADMTTPRLYTTSVTVSDKVYVFGGIGYDSVEDELIVSRAAEAYDASTDTWETLTSMPVVTDDNGVEQDYGVAMGQAVEHGGKVYILSGIRRISNDSLVDAFNDRVLVYTIGTDTWTYSDVLDDSVIDLYSRISPFAFKQSSNAQVVGGVTFDPAEANRNVGIPRSSLIFLTSAYSCDLTGTAQQAADSVSASDGDYDVLPFPRFKGSAVTIGSTHYLLGGSESEAVNTNRVEKINAATTPFATTSPLELPFGLHSFGAATDGTDLYVLGGMSGGRSASFLSMTLSGPATLTVNGKQSLTFELTVEDRNGDPPPSIDVVVDAILEGTVRPVRFDRQTVPVVDGTATVVMQPRSQDPVPLTAYRATDNLYGDAELKAEAVGAPTVFIDLYVQDDFYDGVVRASLPVATESEDLGDAVVSGRNVSLRGSATPSGDNRGVFVNAHDQQETVFDLLPPLLSYGSSAKVLLLSAGTSVPEVRTLIGGNAGTRAQVLAEVARLKWETPFGFSPLYDALAAVNEVMGVNGAFGTAKNVYVFTDQDENASAAVEAGVLSDLRALGESGPAPVTVLDMSLQTPSLESSSVAGADDAHLDRIASGTNGQSFAVIQVSALDNVAADMTGRLVGSVGYGTFEYVVDLRENAMITGLSLSFDLTPNSHGVWRYAFSDDGFEYTNWSDTFADDQSPEFTSITTRFVKVLVALSAGWSSSLTAEGESEPELMSDSPALEAINIVFNKVMTDYLFMKTRTLDGGPDDVVVAVGRPAARIRGGGRGGEYVDEFQLGPLSEHVHAGRRPEREVGDPLQGLFRGRGVGEGDFGVSGRLSFPCRVRPLAARSGY